MRKKRRGLSLGSVLTICLTVAVTAGCVFLFSMIRGGSGNSAMDAQRMIGAVHSFMQGNEDAQPQMTVRIVTVTRSPVTAPPATSVPVTPTPRNDPYTAHSFSLTVGGLLSFQSDISESVYDKTEKTLNYEPVVSPIRTKICSDVNLVTLPQTINTVDRTYGDNMAPAEAAVAVQAMGFDQAALGTEHILDLGAEGAVNTVSVLQSRQIGCAGVNAGGASTMKLVQVNGGAVAILSYTEPLTSKSKNALAAQNNLLTVYNEDTARMDIQSARNQGARCVIVCMYWGRQDATSVTTAQKKTALTLAEMGADIILGTRPSRVLPMELITCPGPDGKSHTAFVAYSLGTLLTESREAFDICGLLLHMNLRSDEQGVMHIESIEYTPTYIWRQNMNGKTQYRLICSNEPPPEGMNDNQKGVLQRALDRIRNVLKNSPVTERK